ncbi:MAG TPA: hypothetical protein VGH54_05490 [Mycobacterium sp.]|jgi:hypothetical protein
MTLRFVVFGIELFTVTVELHDKPDATVSQPTLRSKLRQAVAHSVIR